MNELKAFIKDETAMTTVEVILIVVGNGGTSIKSLT